jgi:potassium efflux system protein
MKTLNMLVLLLLPALAFAAPSAMGPTQAGTAQDESVYQNPARYSEITILEEKLRDEQDQLALSHGYLSELETKQPDDESMGFDSTMAEQASFRVDLASVQQGKIALELSNARKNIRLLKSYINQYENQLINAKARKQDTLALRLEERLSVDTRKLELEQERVKVLGSALGVAEDILALEQEHLSEMTEQIRLEQVSNIWQSQQENEHKWLNLQMDWEAKLDKARTDLDKLRPIAQPPTDKQQSLQNDIMEAEEYLDLLKMELTLSRIESLINVYKSRMDEGDPSRRAIETKQRLDRLKEELISNHIQVDNKELLMERQLAILNEPGAKQLLSSDSRRRQQAIFQGILKEYKQVDAELNQLMSTLAEFQNQLIVGVKQTWQSRQQLPRNVAEWEQFARDLWSLPQLVYQSIVATYNQVVEHLSQASGLLWFGTVVIILMWAAFSVWLSRSLSRFLAGAKSKGMSFSHNTLVVVAQLIFRNIFGMAIFGALLILMLLLDVSSSHYIVPLCLGVVWFSYRIAVGLARISLFENIWDLSGKDVSLYRGLRWSMGFGSVIIALTVLAHQLPISMEVSASFDRLFMLVLLAVSIPLLKGWQVLPSIIAKDGKTKAYVRRAIDLLGLLIPLTIFSNAIIGLVGYVNLAWIIWIAEGQFLMVLTLWVLVRGVVSDAMEYAAKWSIRNLKSGWVWTESILKPLNTILHVVIFISAGAILWKIYGLDKNPIIREKLHVFLFSPLFKIATTEIAAIHIFQFLVLLVVIRWAAKWSREFAYRFLFAKYKDKGLRNSFAVFTQYATIAMGAFVILRVVGIDLTTLTVVLGALAVGIGFGLQGIANNLVSGLLLLIERPFRAGDIITLGANEGEVTHIGVRATTIRTFDNMEVIIPNAETVSQALTNWTHHDSIVRTTFRISVEYYENPRLIQAMLLNIVRRHESVVAHPEPNVLLVDFASYAQVFEVRYHIDLNLGKTRSMVQSEIMLNIWDTFRAANIVMPYPRQTIEIESSET